DRVVGEGGLRKGGGRPPRGVGGGPVGGPLPAQELQRVGGFLRGGRPTGGQQEGPADAAGVVGVLARQPFGQGGGAAARETGIELRQRLKGHGRAGPLGAVGGDGRE